MDIPYNIEHWRLIDGYDNYEVSSHGRVRNNRTNKILKGGENNAGYFFVCLYKNGKVKNCLIHRLVAFAFVPNDKNKPMVDHINRDTKNNHMSNLRWCTNSENQANTVKKEGTTSNYKGVYFHKRDQLYIARIRHNGPKIQIGYFKNEKDAALAYNKKAIEIFGEFAKLNIIE